MLRLPAKEDDSLSTLEIIPISASSVVSGPKTKYMRTGNPSDRQLRGLIGNALGLHSEELMSNRHGHWNPPELLQRLSFEKRESPDGELFDDLRWEHKFRDNARTRSSASAIDGELFGYGRTTAVRQRQEPVGHWEYLTEGPADLLRSIQKALEDPCAPLYIGDSDSWIEAKLKNLRPKTLSSDTDSPT